MEQHPLVTWLMPVKNGMPYLPKTLETIAAQTYPCHRLLVWDNGSQDETLLELARWIPGRIPGFVFTGRPMGLGASLAALVDRAQTEFCARIDADDLNHPERLQRQVEFMLRHPAVGLVGCTAASIDENGQDLNRPWMYGASDAEVRWGTRWLPLNLHPTFLFRRSTVLAAGNYRDCQPIEDHDLLLRLSLVTEIHNLPDTLLQYRRHAKSVTGNTLDYRPQHRAAARMNVLSLFPGLSYGSSMELWDMCYEEEAPFPVKSRHLSLHKRAAVLLAQRLNKPDTYFQESELYRAQHYQLRRQWLEQHGLSGAVALKRALRTLALRFI